MVGLVGEPKPQPDGLSDLLEAVKVLVVLQVDVCFTCQLRHLPHVLLVPRGQLTEDARRDNTVLNI